MATTRHEPINKDVPFKFKDGRKGNGRIWEIKITVTQYDTYYEYAVAYQMFGQECTVRCDDNFNELID